MARRKISRTPLRFLSSSAFSSPGQPKPSNGYAEERKASKKDSKAMLASPDRPDPQQKDNDGTRANGASVTSPFKYAGGRANKDPPSSTAFDHKAATGMQTPPVVKMAIKGGRENRASAEGTDAGHEIGSPAAKDKLPPNGNALKKTLQEELLASEHTTESSHQSHDESGVYSWSDAQLAEGYSFEKEIGFGNWGSCWLVNARINTPRVKSDTTYAVKLVHRQGTPPSNARVKALWNEYKVLRACGKPTHSNLVHFKEFIITPSYALVVMDYYRQAMNVALPESLYAGPNGYFHQLLSSIAWLHERFVTHCDVKVANLLVDTSEDKVHGKPILVDFGFATLHDAKTNFVTSQTWGTPEYLSPERSRGDLHDERLADIWALGVTFFEIATGRTPFEHEEEQFLTKEQLDIYYNRTLNPEWVGNWSIPIDLEKLCKSMLHPDPLRRTYADAALQHSFFRHHKVPRSNNNPQIETEPLREDEGKSKFEESRMNNTASDLDATLDITTSKDSFAFRRAQRKTETKKTSARANENDVIAGSVQLTNNSTHYAVNTPPAARKRNERREQVQTLANDSEGDTDTQSLNASRELKKGRKASQGGRRTPHTPKENDAKHPGSVESATAGKLADPEIRATRKSPYPPSTSKRTASSLRPATSSSERRHSPQKQDSIMQTRPATAQGREYTTAPVQREARWEATDLSSANVQGDDLKKNGWRRKGIDSSSFDRLENEDDDKPSNYEGKHLHSESLEAANEELSSSLKKISFTASKDELMKTMSDSQTYLSRAARSATVPCVVPEELEKRLDEMERVAATLATMVHETRSILHRYRDSQRQDVASFESDEPRSTQNHCNTMNNTTNSVTMHDGFPHPKQVGSRKSNASLTANAGYVRPDGTAFHSMSSAKIAISQAETAMRNKRTANQASCWSETSGNLRHTNAQAAKTFKADDQSPSKGADFERLIEVESKIPREGTRKPEQDRVALEADVGFWAALEGANNKTRTPLAATLQPQMDRHGSGSISSLQSNARSVYKKDEQASQVPQQAKEGSLRSFKKLDHAQPLASPTNPPPQTKTVNDETQGVKLKLSKVKAFTIGRSNSINLLGARRNSGLNAPVAAPTVVGQRRNTILDITSITNQAPVSRLPDQGSPLSPESVPSSPGQLRTGKTSNPRSLPMSDTWGQPRMGLQEWLQHSQTSNTFASSNFKVGPPRVQTDSLGRRPHTSGIGYDPPRAKAKGPNKNRHGSQNEHGVDRQPLLSPHGGMSGSTSGALWRLLTHRVTNGRNNRHAAERTA